jgi:hypothetical protein
MFDWSNKIEKCFQNFNFNDEKSTTNTIIPSNNSYLFVFKKLYSSKKSKEFILSLRYLLTLIWNDCLFFLLIVLALFQIYDIYASYSVISILICPLKTWNLLFVIYFRLFKLSNLKPNDFNLNLIHNKQDEQQDINHSDKDNEE